MHVNPRREFCKLRIHKGRCYTAGQINCIYRLGSPMELTPEAVREIAALARLDLDEAEVRLFAEQLSACLDHFRKLQEVNSDDVEPTASVLPLRNVLRADEVGAALTPNEVIANAPDAEDFQFRVSAVLED